LHFFHILQATIANITSCCSSRWRHIIVKNWENCQLDV
jgi:hypothetical protein